MADIRIIIDDREREISAKIEDRIYTDNNLNNVGTKIKISSVTKRLDIADYIIINKNNINNNINNNNTILAIIERKTWSDFAASIKDGRHYNKDKMIELREESSSQDQSKIIYVVEGPRPKSHEKIDGIPYVTIESAIFHLIWRDNIQVLFTADQSDTADMLIRLALSLGRLILKNEIKIGSSHSEETKVTAKNNKTNIIDNNNIHWSAIPGISAELSKMITAADVTLAAVITADDSNKAELITKISNIKFPSGRTLTRPQIQSLFSYTQTDKFLLDSLSLITGISKKTAAELTEKISIMKLESQNEDEWWVDKSNIMYLLSMADSDLADMIIGKLRLGPSKAKKILDTFGRISWE